MSASNAMTPPWIVRADRAYGLVLLLVLPNATRSDCAGLMRQTFRDRCREAARKERSLAGLMFGEILPDLVHAAWLEHLAAPGIVGRRRWLGWGAAIAMTLGLALSANTIGEWFWQHFNPPRMFYLAEKEKMDDRLATLRAFIATLGARPQPEAQAAGLWLRGLLQERYRELPGARSTSEQQDEVRQARDLAMRIDALGTTGLAPAALAALADVCLPDDGCHRDAVLAALREQTPGNGYVQLYRLRELTGPRREAQAQAAIATLAASQRVDGYEAEWMHAVLALRDKFGAAGPDLDRALYEITNFVGRLQPGFNMANTWCVQPAWLVQPAVAADCSRVASLFERSGNTWGLRAAARIRIAQADDADSRAKAQAEADRWQETLRDSVVRASHPADAAAAKRWMLAWREASTEAAAHSGRSVREGAARP